MDNSNYKINNTLLLKNFGVCSFNEEENSIIVKISESYKPDILLKLKVINKVFFEIIKSEDLVIEEKNALLDNCWIRKIISKKINSEFYILDIDKKGQIINVKDIFDNNITIRINESIELNLQVLNKEVLDILSCSFLTESEKKDLIQGRLQKDNFWNGDYKISSK